MDDNSELEEQFILRIPLDSASKIRSYLKKKSSKAKKKNIKIELNFDEQKGAIKIGKSRYHQGVIKTFPTIIESYKPNIIKDDKSLMVKTAGITCMLDCTANVDADMQKENLHGYTPPLKNVKKRRFRKTIINVETVADFDEIVKELKFLFRADLEAVSTTYQILRDDMSCKGIEESIFGELSSDSEDE